jgi:bifunctional isochorismate lyase / aryl carrier protein
VNPTKDDIRETVATLLNLSPTDLNDDDNLFDWGLDSIRLLTLLEVWRKDDPTLTFVQLAETPTLNHWHTRLTQKVRT